MKNILQRFNFKIVLVLLSTILMVLFAFVTIQAKSFWLDEIYSVKFAKSLHSLFFTAVYSEANMVLYYFLLHFWMKLGHSELIIRSLSALLAVISVPLIYKLGKKLFNTNTGLIAGFLFSINAFIIEYAQEARSYSFVVLLVILSSLFLLDLIKTINRRNYLLYVLSCISLLLTHYFSIFILVTQGLYCFFNKGSISKKQILLTYTPVILFIALAAQLPSFRDQGNINWIPNFNFGGVIQLFLALSGGMYTVVGSILLVLWLLYLLLNKKLKYNSALQLVLISMFIPILGAIIVSLIIKPIFQVKYLIVCLPFYILLQSYALASIHNKRITKVILIVFFLLSVLNINFLYFGKSKEDWRSAARYVTSQYRPGDTIYFYAYFIREPFDYYARGTSTTGVPLTVTNLSSGTYESGNKDLPGPDTSVINASKFERIWLVLSHDEVMKLRVKQRDAIMKSIQINYVLVKEQDFSNIRVLRFEKRTH